MPTEWSGEPTKKKPRKIKVFTWPELLGFAAGCGALAVLFWWWTK